MWHDMKSFDEATHTKSNPVTTWNAQKKKNEKYFNVFISEWHVQKLKSICSLFYVAALSTTANW